MQIQSYHQGSVYSYIINRYYYPFSTDVPITGISSFTITVTNGRSSTTYNNGGHGYPIQDTVFYLANSASISSSEVATISAAVSFRLILASIVTLAQSVILYQGLPTHSPRYLRS